MRSSVVLGLAGSFLFALSLAHCGGDSDDGDLGGHDAADASNKTSSGATASGGTAPSGSSGSAVSSSSGGTSGAPPDGGRPGPDGGVIVAYTCTREVHLSPAGDDAHDGSAAAPKKSIAKAAHDAVAGDCLQVHAGKYAEADTIAFANDGTAAAPIVVRSADGPRAAIVDASARAGGGGPAVSMTKDHVILDGFDFQNMPTAGGEQVVHFDGGKQTGAAPGKGVGSVMRNCKLTGGHDHVKINQWATGLTIEYNEMFGSFGHIPFSVTSAKDLVVRGNWFHDWQSEDDGFIQIKGGSRDVTVEANLFEDIDGPSGAVTMGDGCAASCDFDPEHYACVNGRTLNNVMVHVGRMVDAYGCKDCTIANNTGVDVGTATVALKLGLTTTGSTERATTNMQIKNNIVADADGKLFGVIQINGAAGTGLTMNHNLYFNGPTDVPSDAPAGADANSIVDQNPGFAGPSDFSPATGSPAIGAGQPLPGVVDYDYAGNARGGSNDIGAFQH